MTSSSHETTQSIDLNNIFEHCVIELDKLCKYYTNNTRKTGLFRMVSSLPKKKQFCARYLMAEYLRILFYDVVRMEPLERSALSDTLKESAISVITQTTSILKAPFDINLYQIETIIAAAQWVSSCLNGESVTAFEAPLPSQADLLAGNKNEREAEYLDFEGGNLSSVFMGFKKGRSKTFFTTYQKIYQTCASSFIFPVELSEALNWFLNNPTAMDYLPAIKQNASALYIRASSTGNLDFSCLMNHPEELLEDRLAVGLYCSIAALASSLFPPLIALSVAVAVTEGEALQRAERAIKLILPPQTTTDLWFTVSKGSRHPNRKSSIFALSVAILWCFAQMKCGKQPPLASCLTPALEEFADKLAPLARELVAVARSNSLDTTGMRENGGSDDDNDEMDNKNNSSSSFSV